ncbi:2-oxoacid dehydrogenase acyltransferase [Gracilaria domingensis]|nr:2-oxoacid dehydrogenase acyltransferase [Gracilaria domingensis]
MPALSSTMTEGRIVQWLKQPGDKIEVGEAIMVVESDKADMDVESFEAGYLALIQVEEGESADVGAPVGIIVENKDDISRVSTSAPPPSKAPVASDPPPSPTPPAPSAPPAASASSQKPNFAEVFMPALSSTMTEGRVVDWTKSEGDPISVGEIFMVVESDKADMDVESFEDGFVAHILVDAGESCPVGEPVAYVARTEAEIPAVKAWATSSAASTSTSTPTGSGTQSTTQEVEAPVAAPSTASESATSESAAVVNEGRIVASPLAKATAKKEGIDLKYVKGSGPNGRIVEADVIKAKESVPAKPYVSQSGKTIATPDAKKIAKKEKIDLGTVIGTGNFGRITAEDVLKAAGKAPVSATKKVSQDAVSQNGASKATIPADSTKTITEMPAGAVAMNAMQKAVVQNMNASLSVPVFRLTYTIKTKALDELYAKLKPKGVTISALLAKAVAIVLTRHPIMNAGYADDSIVYRANVNVAMAVALKDGGLITPTLIDADKTDLYSLSRNWKDLVKRAMEKKLAPKEYSSGTFVISNLGMFGVDQFDAILPPGVPGILAIGASKPIVALQDNGLVGVHKEMKVTLTADHRHIYGTDGAEFLKDLTHLLENEITELVM